MAINEYNIHSIKFVFLKLEIKLPNTHVFINTKYIKIK